MAALAGLSLAAAGTGCDSTSDDPAPGEPAPVPADLPAASEAFYGVATQAPLSDGDLDRMAEGGIGTLRSFFAWQALDPTPAPGDLDWAGPDAMIAGAAKRGIAVFPYLFSTPDWVSRIDAPDCDPASCPIVAPRSPRTLAAWREFAAAAVARYGPGGEFWRENPELPESPVRTWQIWNEQNSPSAYAPAPSVEDYAELLRVASEAIRARDPGASIVVGGMFGTPFKGQPPALTAADFLRRLYAVPEITETFDAVAAHPYAAHVTGVDEQVSAVHDEVLRAADDAKVWITEVGWSSAEGDSPLERGPEGQAENLAGAYDLFLSKREAWRIEGVIWYSWRDFTGLEICDWCAQSGLFEEGSLTAKPAWDAFASLPRE